MISPYVLLAPVVAVVAVGLALMFLDYARPCSCGHRVFFHHFKGCVKCGCKIPFP